MSKRFGRPSPAMVVAVLALVMATTGTAIGAKTLITSTSQIKNGVISGADIKDRSIALRDLSSGVQRSVRAATTGSGIDTVEIKREAGPLNPKGAGEVEILELTGLDPGAYVISGMATIDLTKSDANIRSACRLDAQPDGDLSEGTHGGLSTTAIVRHSMQTVKAFSSGTGVVKLLCRADGGEWFTSRSSIIATKVDTASLQHVDG